MRIAVFIKSTTFNSNYGGLETQNKLLCEGLAEAGDEVIVFAPAPDVPTGGTSAGETLKVFEPSRLGNAEVEEPALSAGRSAGLSYVFVDSPAGKYSKKWFRKSVELFKELHKEEPFDAVISQSMAGQEVINYLRASSKGPAQGETPGVGSAETPEVRELGRGEKMPVCVVIQHGTILGELKTRWQSLPSFPFRVSRSRRPPAGGGRSGEEEIKRENPYFGYSPDQVGIETARDFFKSWLFFFFRLIPYGIKIYIQDQIRLRRADKVIAVSDLVKNSLVREYFLPEEKVNVVYNGIEVERFTNQDSRFKIRKELGIEAGEKVLLYVGRVEKEKGLGKLLEAVSNFKFEILNLELVIVGDGPYLAGLKNLAKELGIANKVIFTGKVPYESVPDYYAAADVFVLPSLRQEGLPMTLPEAMAAGLPVVASRIGGIPNAVEDGKTGFLVEPGNVKELSEVLDKLLVDDTLREAMSRNAQELARGKFSQKEMVEGTLAVIRECRNI